LEKALCLVIPVDQLLGVEGAVENEGIQLHGLKNILAGIEIHTS
jgi:hypothetical protein